MFTHEQCMAWLRAFAALVESNKDLLTDLDAAIGDADHGTNMARGMTAVLGKLDPTSPLGSMFKSVGMTLVSTVGGSAGPLYGTFFMKFGAKLGEVEDVSLPTFANALAAGRDGVIARGKAAVGEKTMIDALTPAVEAFESHVDDGPLAAAEAALAAARQGRDATIPLVATKGRASYLGERSAGHQDPGATSTTYLFEALVAAVEES
ncbi:dihydroxyacetone kinase subunit DhaL [[Pseudopropionibacterium] massiliense]|uniref:dihydroxyacetone kinase subunit DhaL n=1 Tax=[Pseudopropionibacterium] massiliense TaxID=2220000 RepID=UPI001032681B|nr:dihydroxyacetone kinase subunit DhaL [[Pseudopropionibacterium] massiliense]